MWCACRRSRARHTDRDGPPSPTASTPLAQRLNLLADVSAVLPGHSPVFVAHDSGPVVDEDGVKCRQDFGLATCVCDDHPVVGLDARFVHSRYADHAVWPPGGRSRAALTVTVHDRVVDRVVLVIQTHGLRDPAGKHDTPARAGQAERLAVVVESVRSTLDLTVLCGDLNVLPTSNTFHVLHGVEMVDLVGSAHPRSSRRQPMQIAEAWLIPTALPASA
jgi:hypothetical protein